jgi:sarcosine oxidase subunit alpha
MKNINAEYEIIIVGGGPAGLSAAAIAAELGAKIAIIDDNPIVGGQLIKQTHKFFGSKSHYCGVRGIDIAKILDKKIHPAPISTTECKDDKKSKDTLTPFENRCGVRHPNITLLLDASVVGYYEDNILGVLQKDKFIKLYASKIIFATGAAENLIAFPNNDLPGVYGAGAVQTLMNVHGVLPGKRALMVGSGNIGLIVSYQMMQAGIEVVALIEILDKIGGYNVHAAKLRRLGVPIFVSHTIKYATGKDYVTGAVITKVNKKFHPIKGTDKHLKVDMICLAVGLTPLSELLYQAGCEVIYMPELGGNVAWHNENMETSKKGIFVAGDASGIEEASTAMLEGRIAGASAYESHYGKNPKAQEIIQHVNKELEEIRQGPFGTKPRLGKEKLSKVVFKD